jgi:hypothetical protein
MNIDKEVVEQVVLFDSAIYKTKKKKRSKSRNDKRMDSKDYAKKCRRDFSNALNIKSQGQKEKGILYLMDHFESRYGIHIKIGA